MSWKTFLLKEMPDLAEDAAAAVARAFENVTPTAATKKAAISSAKAQAQAKTKAPAREAPRTAAGMFDARKGEQRKLAALSTTARRRVPPPEKRVNLGDYEGRGFITSMADRSDAGSNLLSVNNIPLPDEVELLGGQGFMFERPGHVWANDAGMVGKHLKLARELRAQTGQDPLFMPWSMGPRAIDFSHMPGEVMLKYAAANMTPRTLREVNKDLAVLVPGFRDARDPDSIEAFSRSGGATRKKVTAHLDKKYRDRGGLSLGEARAATTDPEQLGLRLTDLRNVGVIEGAGGPEASAHASFPVAVPGEGLGVLDRPVGALELLPDLLARAGLDDPFGFPVGVAPGAKSPMRTLQMAPQGGILTEDILKQLGYKHGGRVKKARARGPGC